MATAYAETFRDCIAQLNEVIILIGEDEHNVSTCFEGRLLQDYREVTRRETKALEDVRRTLRRGC